MNKFAFILLLLFYTPLLWRGAGGEVFAQINLVPNGGFELYSTCPTGNDNITEATGWLKFRSTPDYYNACAPSGGMSVPNSNIGYQPANSGNAIAGLITFATGLLNYREVIGYQISQALVVGQKYYFKMNVNKAPLGASGQYAINSDKIGVNFSNIQYSISNPAPVTNSAVVYADTIITDAMGWYKLQGSFIATQNYQYLMIGNFFDDSHTDTTRVNNLGSIAYYFVDDVCLSTDSSYCSLFTNIEQIKNECRLIINDGAIKINCANQLNIPYLISIYEASGKTLYRRKVSDASLFTISTNLFKSGFYLVEIRSSKEKHFLKLALNN